jgi:uncharacterized membrane protein affecting hemolysin expression/class 3 adenylate cyclase
VKNISKALGKQTAGSCKGRWGISGLPVILAITLRRAGNPGQQPGQFRERSKLTVKQQKSKTGAAELDDAKPRATGGHVATRFTIAIACLVALSMSVFWLISNYTNKNMLRQQADYLGETLARQTALQVTEPVLANDLISTRVVLEQLTRGSAIAEAAVINVNGAVIASSTNELEPPLSLLPIPVEFEDARAGTVRIVLDLSYIEAGTGNNLIFILVATFAIMLVAILLSINYFQYLISFPIRLLNYAIQDIRYGEVKSCPDPETNNEIGRLIRQFNATAEFLANYTFLSAENQQPDKTLEERQRQHQSNTVSGAVLCIRLDNFHFLASTCDRKTLVTLLNRIYFMSENIGRLYNGAVSYCADGEVVIDFHNSQLDDEQCFYAVCAGQLFLRLIGRIVKINPSRPANAKFRLAVHFGEFQAGLYSPVTGAFDNVHGITLDSVRALCSSCPDNSLLVSEIAYQMAGGESRIVGEEFGELDEPQPLTTLLCSNALASYRQLLDQQADKLALLLSPSTQGANR